tara:strand:+ start:531 stop:1118 length:588 start_codon:yes stop_codon:yes gene_type:complete
MATLSTFKQKIGYGLRPNLFRVTIPTAGTAIQAAGEFDEVADQFSFLCRSAGIPASTVGTVEVPFRGRVIKLPGDRTFESWTITVMADEDLALRAFFEQWMDRLNKHDDGAGFTAGSEYAATLQVDQLARTATSGTADTDPHKIVRTYQFLNAFPSNLAQIDLAYDNNNSIAEYTVEFQYDYWTVENSVGTQALT